MMFEFIDIIIIVTKFNNVYTFMLNHLFKLYDYHVLDMNI